MTITVPFPRSGLGLFQTRWKEFERSIRRRTDYIIGFIAPAIGPNTSRKLTRLTAPAHNIHGKVWMKQHTKDLRGNPKPRVSPDRTGPDRNQSGSGNSFKNIFGSVRVGEFYFGSVRVGVFFTGYETFSPGISGINLPFIPKLKK